MLRKKQLNGKQKAFMLFKLNSIMTRLQHTRDECKSLVTKQSAMYEKLYRAVKSNVT